MFTGIIETLGKVKGLEINGQNLTLEISSDISGSLKVDQSVTHNGVCLTVSEQGADTHKVIAVHETLDRSNLGSVEVGDSINLERAMLANGRFDGHIVQGHVDQQATCTGIDEEGGSWRCSFGYSPSETGFLVEKGSVCLDGVSLTIASLEPKSFSVAIIPFTFEHTTFKYLKVGDKVNLEFDILGKYVAAKAAHRV